MDLILCGNSEAIVMVEAGANEASEEIMLKAFDEGQAQLSTMAKEIGEMAKDIGKKKFEFIAKNDVYEGELKEWDEKGNLIHLANFKNGQEEGIQKIAEAHWNAQKTKWLSYHPFSSKKSSFPQQKEWKTHPQLELSLQKGNLRSVARIWKTEGTGWKIAWIE